MKQTLNYSQPESRQRRIGIRGICEAALWLLIILLATIAALTLVFVLVIRPMMRMFGIYL